MKLICIILILLCSCLTIQIIHYREQIKSIKNQLDFLNHHETNMIVTSSYEKGCLTDLVSSINDTIKKTAASKKKYVDNENTLKDTITSLSHDIRTPLASMDGYFQLLVKSKDPIKIQKYLKIIRQRIKSLNEMLEQLFTYAKLNNQDYALELRKCCINQILFDVIFSFYDNFKAKDIEPNITIPDKAIMISANEVALKRIFQNILKNYLEHGNGQIAITMSLLSNSVLTTFTNEFDSSKNLNIDKMFERFYKADLSRNATSSGLGLSIAKELASRMNGSIQASTDSKHFKISICFHM